MTHRNQLIPIVIAVALLAMASFVGAQDAPDFKSGGNTWADSKVGDWVLYKLKDGPGVRFEVKEIAENGDITFQHTIYNPQGEVVADNSRTRAPAQCPVQQKVPADKEVAWGEAVYPFEGAELTCQRATWLSEKSETEAWFHATIPCGGIAKTATDGADSVWITAFKRDGKEYRLAEKKDPEPQPEPQPEPEPLGVAVQQGRHPAQQVLPGLGRQLPHGLLADDPCAIGGAGGWRTCSCRPGSTARDRLYYSGGSRGG